MRRQRGRDKTARNPIKITPVQELAPKPPWIRVRAPGGERFAEMKKILRRNKLHSVCEEASCPNIGECFGKGAATFMILGDICTRRCPFCDVAHGRPGKPDAEEPRRLAQTIAELRLRYVVITSVDRDDLPDGGAQHFAECIAACREEDARRRNKNKNENSAPLKIEILTPDFRGRMDKALRALSSAPPDVFNHNLETVPRLYKEARPGADYKHSLKLLAEARRLHAQMPTKSGLMVGLGETDDEIREVMQHLREHNVGMLTIGQYLQPTRGHLPVRRFVPPAVFDDYAKSAAHLGFAHAACGPLVRSSYHADQQAGNVLH